MKDIEITDEMVAAAVGGFRHASPHGLTRGRMRAALVAGLAKVVPSPVLYSVAPVKGGGWGVIANSRMSQRLCKYFRGDRAKALALIFADGARIESGDAIHIWTHEWEGEIEPGVAYAELQPNSEGVAPSVGDDGPAATVAAPVGASAASYAAAIAENMEASFNQRDTAFFIHLFDHRFPGQPTPEYETILAALRAFGRSDVEPQQLGIKPITAEDVQRMFADALKEVGAVMPPAKETDDAAKDAAHAEFVRVLEDGFQRMHKAMLAIRAYSRGDNTFSADWRLGKIHALADAEVEGAEAVGAVASAAKGLEPEA